MFMTDKEEDVTVLSIFNIKSIITSIKLWVALARQLQNHFDFMKYIHV